jgi:hypothetical protein
MTTDASQLTSLNLSGNRLVLWDDASEQAVTSVSEAIASNIIDENCPISALDLSWTGLVREIMRAHVHGIDGSLTYGDKVLLRTLPRESSAPLRPVRRSKSPKKTVVRMSSTAWPVSGGGSGGSGTPSHLSSFASFGDGGGVGGEEAGEPAGQGGVIDRIVRSPSFDGLERSPSFEAGGFSSGVGGFNNTASERVVNAASSASSAQQWTITNKHPNGSCNVRCHSFAGIKDIAHAIATPTSTLTYLNLAGW